MNKRDVYRWGLVVFSGLYTFFFAGAYFGYGPMILLLQRDEAFLSKCDGDIDLATSSCPNQISALLNIHFVGMLMQMLSPFIGHLCDKYGPLIMMIFTSSVACLGVSLLIVSRTYAIDWVLYPTFCFLNLTSNATSVMIMITGRYFAVKSKSNSNAEKEKQDEDPDPLASSSRISDKKRRRVIGLLNNLFDGGSVTYLILWQIQKTRPKISLQMLAIGYLILGLFVFGGALFFWKVLLNSYNVNTSTKQKQNSTNNTTSKSNEKENWKELRSTSFLWLNAFFAFHICRNQFTLTSAEAFLKDLGDDNNTYIEIFTYIMPVSVIGLPLVDLIIAKFGYHIALQSINILAIAHGIIQISSDNLNIQIIGFVIFSFYRCFIFSVIFAFLSVLLRPQVLGKANGLMHTSAGLAGFLNIPLGNLAIQKWGGSFFIPNLIYTVAIVPFFYATWRCAVGAREKDDHNNDQNVVDQKIAIDTNQEDI